MIRKIIILLKLVLIINSELIREEIVNGIDSINTRHNFDITKDIKPIRYDIDLRLDPDFDFKYYNGTTRIRFVSLVNSNQLMFHFNKTAYSDVHLIKMSPINRTTDPDDFNVTFYTGFLNEFVLLESNNVGFLEKGEVYELHMEFTTRFIEGSDNGFYKTCNKLRDGTKTCFAATQMEIHNIRNTFPSFDYVGFKAHFNLNITHHKSLMALSNMPGTIISDGLCDMVTTTFEQTPVMSTYILAFAVGKFDRIPIENESNIKINLYTPIEASLGSSTVQKYTGALLKALENYVNKTYSLSKLDFLATSTHSTLGMENWGLVLYNYNAILDKSDPPTIKNFEKSIAVVAHELAHQFFGNLVTMKERKHLWLNEGFATYFTHRAMATVFPEGNYLSQIVIADIDGSFYLEKILNTTILDNWQENMSITQTTIYYNKGSAIIQMLNHVMGERSFQQMVRNYIDRYKYDSVTSDNLIDEIQLVNSVDKTISDDIDIKGFMESWLNQEQLPVVTVTRNYETGEVQLSQQPYYECSEKQCSNVTWWIPFNYATKSKPCYNSTFPDGWLKNVPSIKLSLNLASDDWILLNRHSTGYYFVNYDTKNWKMIANLLASDQYEIIPATDRAKILIDAFLLSYNNQILPIEIVTDLLRVLKHDRSYLTWKVADKYIRKQFGYYSEKLFKQNNGTELIKNLLQYFGTEEQPGENRETKLTRDIALNWICDIELNMCHQIFNQISMAYIDAINNNKTYKVSPDRQKFVFCYGFTERDDDFVKLFNYARQIDDKQLLGAIYTNFDCHSNLTIFRKYYVPIVYNLKLPKELIGDQALLIKAFQYREYINDIDTFNKCLIEKCYDFEAHYPDVAERRVVVFTILENIIDIMQRKFELKPAATIHQLLDTVDQEFGGDVCNKIRNEFDLTKRYLNYGLNKLV